MDSEMSTTLAVATMAEPALSAARVALARAQSRKDADAALSEAVKTQKVAEQLGGHKIKARIVELERKTAGDQGRLSP
jgi:hypothetical protein